MAHCGAESKEAIEEFRPKGRLDPMGNILTDSGATAVRPSAKAFMNKTRFSFLLAAVALFAMTGGLRAQTSIQRITLSLLADYQTNTFFTNTASSSGPLTNEYSRIHHILIATGNVVKAIAVDLQGTNWTNLAGSLLVREVNLTNGTEGIFLRNGASNVNVSSFFGVSYSNNFTAGLTNGFPSVTNNFTLEDPLVQGWLRMTGPTNFTTNYIKTSAVYFFSLNTTNIKFDMVGVGEGEITPVIGGLDGVRYERPINTEIVGTVGAFSINTTTNVFDLGSNAPAFLSGPIRGSIILGQPYFSELAPP
jgi:hypothetical protein